MFYPLCRKEFFRECLSFVSADGINSQDKNPNIGFAIVQGITELIERILSFYIIKVGQKIFLDFPSCFYATQRSHSKRT